LAAGVSFFVCIILTILCVLDARFVPAILLASLGGSLLGFLRYNYNPATIFMGDSGSYFIGYTIATVSIAGSFKGQTAASIMIPMIALGIPLMDVAWATIRRFLFGQKIFGADRDHVHHRLMSLGLTQKRAVLILYASTIIMGAVAIIAVHTNDAKTGIILLLVAVAAIISIQRLGYLNFIKVDRFLRWGSNVSDELGISRDSRMFFASQMDIIESKDEVQFKANIIKAAQLIGLDFLEINLFDRTGNPECIEDFSWHMNDRTKNKEELYSKKRLYLRFPLQRNGEPLGTIRLSKDMFDSSQFHARTLRRIAYLRHTISEWIYEKKKASEL